MSSTGKRRILISGAGIAGLCAALELAARGWQVQLFEKASALSEAGAGLQLAPNAMRHLQRLGVSELLTERAVSPDKLFLVNGRNAQPLLAMELGKTALARWKYPYLVCHRTDLQSALVDICRRNPSIEINLGSQILDRQYIGEQVRAKVQRDAAIDFIEADYRLGCDGVWSTERHNAGYDRARFSGYIAWRKTIPTSALPSSFRDALPQKSAVSAWLGKNAHFVAYPVKAGEFFNFVAITTGENPGEVWSKAGDHQVLKNIFQRWSAPVRDVIAMMDDCTYWPLFEMTKARFVCNERTILIGDAAHAMTPFAAQGAALAIEDAAALAEALDQPDPTVALQHFDIVRKSRAQEVAKRGKLNRFAYHASGPFAIGRNLLFSHRSAEAFLSDLDWLYGYDAIAAMQAN